MWSELDARMITYDGNIRRYVNSNIIDVFEIGDCADISFPNGYNKGNRVYKNICPCITTNSDRKIIVKTEGNSLMDDNTNKLDGIDTKYKQTFIPTETSEKSSEVGFIQKGENGIQHQSNTVYDENGVARTLSASDYKIPMLVMTKQDVVNELNKNVKHQQDLIQSEDGICRTIPAGTHGSTPHLLKTLVEEPKIIKYDVPQQVRVRKFNVNTDKLKIVLRSAKEQSNITNKEIADKLNVGETTVEHWFRADECFAIPTDDIWFSLKRLLNIETDEFDESITTFEERDGVYDRANRLYDSNGIAPTLTNQEEKILEEKPVKIGNIDTWGQRGYVYSNDGISPTLLSTDYKTPKLVQVDGVAPKIQVVGNYSKSGHDASRIVDTDGIAPTVKENHGTVTGIVEYDESENREYDFYVTKKYKEFIDKNGYVPELFNPYNSTELKDVAPTITTQSGSVTASGSVLKTEEPKIINPLKDKTDYGWHFEQQVYDEDGITRAVKAGEGSGNIPKVIEEPFIVASRGRNPDNPSSRVAGEHTEQRLEINSQGTTNTITTVQKDNYVVEPNVLRPVRNEYGKQVRKEYESGELKEKRGNMVDYEPRNDGVSNTITTVQKDNYVNEPTIFGSTQEHSAVSNNGVCPTLTSAMGNGGGHVPMHNYDYRIRKLTPKECWRLMGFTDEEFERAEKSGVSNTQLYKQAGNSIVVNVLEEIFRILILQDMSNAENPDVYIEESKRINVGDGIKLW